MYCCFTRCLSGRCSMLNEMPLLRAPENKRTGMEMSPKVKWPDQTDDGIVFPRRRLLRLAESASVRDGVAKLHSTESLAQNSPLMHQMEAWRIDFRSLRKWGCPVRDTSRCS